MRIIITGVNGFLGSNLARHFLSMGFSVVGIRRSASDLYRLQSVLENPQLQLVTAEQLESVFSQPVDAVIHTATNFGRHQESWEEISAVNVELPLLLWGLSKAQAAKVFINTDTFMSTEIPPEDIYYNYVTSKKLFIKKALEQLPENSTKFVNMVVYHMYGPYDNAEKFLAVMARRLRAHEKEIELSGGQQRRDFIYIDDVVQAFASVLKVFHTFSNFEEFYIGTGSAHAIKEAVMLLSECIQSRSLLQWGALEDKKYDQSYGAALLTENKKLLWKANITLSEGLKKVAESYL